MKMQTSRFGAKSERGFGLGEFALVLSIFGLLLSIALPAYLSYRIQTINSAAEVEVVTFGHTAAVHQAKRAHSQGILHISCQSSNGSTQAPAGCPEADIRVPGGIEG